MALLDKKVVDYSTVFCSGTLACRVPTNFAENGEFNEIKIIFGHYFIANWLYYLDNAITHQYDAKMLLLIFISVANS
ncbi:hypothetical protein [Serratia quinivorans]|uniref:hypothetical protein n=1 Tax=Serratia quinivorans TaxID=137545 RepID=UPI0021B76179|nr:hypothetical protein [Serratia quinivorans]